MAKNKETFLIVNSFLFLLQRMIKNKAIFLIVNNCFVLFQVYFIFKEISYFYTKKLLVKLIAYVIIVANVGEKGKELK